MACPKSFEEKTNKAVELLGEGKYEKALSVLRGLLKKDPECHHTMAQMGKVHKEYGNFLIKQAGEIAKDSTKPLRR